jgi:hypothetical protein
MGAVAAISEDRRGPAQALQPGAALTGALEGGFVFSVGRGNPTAAVGIKVHEEPQEVQDVSVTRCMFGPLDDPIGGTGEEVRMDGIERDIDARGVPAILSTSDAQLCGFGEVSTDYAAPRAVEDPQFRDRVRESGKRFGQEIHGAQ